MSEADIIDLDGDARRQRQHRHPSGEHGRVLGVFNGKGGTSKSTTAVNVAAIAASLGNDVLLVDLDDQGTVTQWLGHVPHTMWNAGLEPARIIELYTPGGFELFFKDFGERLRQGPTGLDELNRLGAPHGIRFFDDWILNLKAAYNLRLIGE